MHNVLSVTTRASVQSSSSATISLSINAAGYRKEKDKEKTALLSVIEEKQPELPFGLSRKGGYWGGGGGGGGVCRLYAWQH